MRSGADHLATTGLDDVCRVSLHIFAVGVVNRDEVPGLPTGFECPFDRTQGLDVGVVGPVDAVGRAVLSRQIGAGRAAVHNDAVLLAS
ncbi:hypothetical protein D9M68_998970 [compost metagenome]